MEVMAERSTPRNPLFDGRWFEDGIIILCLRWYGYKLSYRDLVEMMGERGIPITHTTILRWAVRYAEEFEKRWRRYERTVGGSWRADETYIRVRGRWVYLYRAGGRQRQNHRLLSESNTGQSSGDRLLSESHEASRPAAHDHARWFPAEPFRAASNGDAKRVQLSLGEPGEYPLLSVFE